MNNLYKNNYKSIDPVQTTIFANCIWGDGNMLRNLNMFDQSI